MGSQAARLKAVRGQRLQRLWVGVATGRGGNGAVACWEVWVLVRERRPGGCWLFVASWRRLWWGAGVRSEWGVQLVKEVKVMN